jgi:uncharacterized membrane protein
MVLLVLGLALFLGAHGFTRARSSRTRLIGRIGETPYKLGYSLVSLAGLSLIVIGWRSAPYVELLSPPVWTRHLAALLVWPAFVLFAAAYLPGRIQAAAKHPMLAGLKLWATAHLLANGDLASVVLFGALLAYGVAARILVKRAGPGEGRGPRSGPGRNDLLAAAIGTAAYLLFGAYLHPLLIGKNAFPI